jgi:hypothetical protein
VVVQSNQTIAYDDLLHGFPHGADGFSGSGFGMYFE